MPLQLLATSTMGLEAVVSREFLAACTTVLRRASHHDPVHALPRVDMFYLSDPRRLRRLALGRLDPYLAFRRFGRRVRALLGPGGESEVRT